MSDSIKNFGNWKTASHAAAQTSFEKHTARGPFRFPMGQTKWRCLPPLDGDLDPAGKPQEVPWWVHYIHWVDNPQRKGRRMPLTCVLLTAGERCLLCEQGDALRASPAKADKDAAADLEASPSYYVRGIIRGMETLGVKVLQLTTQAFLSMREIWNDPKQGDFSDPEYGFDLTLVRTPKPGSDDSIYTVISDMTHMAPLSGETVAFDATDRMPNPRDEVRLPDPMRLAQTLSAFGASPASLGAPPDTQVLPSGTRGGDNARPVRASDRSR